MFSFSLDGPSRARLGARKFMNEETAGMTQGTHSFCNVCFLGRQNEPFGDIRTSVGDSLLRGITSAASELVSKRIRRPMHFRAGLMTARIYGRDFASLLIALRKTFSMSICNGLVYDKIHACDPQSQVFYINSSAVTVII